MLPWYSVGPTYSAGWLVADDNTRPLPGWLERSLRHDHLLQLKGPMTRDAAEAIAHEVRILTWRSDRMVFVNLRKVLNGDRYLESRWNDVLQRLVSSRSPPFERLPDAMKQRIREQTFLRQHCDIVRALTLEDWGGER